MSGENAGPSSGSTRQQGSAASREHAALVRAAAWYYVTYHPECQREDPKEGSVRLFSFAWLVADRLARIKQAQRSP
jgi:hypothetical protein